MNLKHSTAITAAAMAGLALTPTAAIAKPPTPKHAHSYLRAYRTVASKFGHRAPGRNIVRWGLQGREATDRDVTRSLAVLHRMLVPRPSAAVTAGVRAITSAVSTGVATLSAGAAGVPACASESGSNYSTGPSNTNASSGATGRYQITPGTSAAYGCSLGTPAGQDRCAAVIFARQGAGAWVGCGG